MNLQLTKKYLVFSISALMFFYLFAQANVYDALSKNLLSYYSLTNSQLGFISSLYFYGNIILLIPAGLVVDRIAPKYIMPPVLLLAACMTYLTSTANQAADLALLRLLMGALSAFGFISCVKVASLLFPNKRMATAIAIIATFGMLGGALIQAPFAYLITKTSWQAALRYFSLLGALLAFLIFFITHTLCLPKTDGKQALSLWNSIKKVLSLGNNWLCAGYTSLMNLPVYLLASLWGIPYLETARHYSAVEAGNVMSILFLGLIVGSPLAGFLADLKTLSIKTVMSAGSIASLTLLFFIFDTQLNYLFECITFFLLGITISSQVLGYPIVVKKNPPAISALATSFISMMTLLAGAIVQPLYGVLSNLFIKTAIMEKANTYALILILITAFTLSLLFNIFIRGGDQQ